MAPPVKPVMLAASVPLTNPATPFARMTRTPVALVTEPPAAMVAVPLRRTMTVSTAPPGACERWMARVPETVPTEPTVMVALSSTRT